MKRRRNRNRREEVLQAAIQLFDEKGYAGTSMNDLADAVGLLKGSLYHYTGSKEALLARIFQQGSEDSLAVLDQIGRMDISAGERVREFVRAWSLWYMENLPVASIHVAEWKHLTGARLRTTIETRRDVYERVVRLFEGVKAEGGAPAGLDTRYVSLFVLSVINGLPAWYRPGQGDQPNRVAGAYADMVVRMVRSATCLREIPAAVAVPAARVAVPDLGDEDRSEELLKAAIDVFSREGYSRASMQEVSEETSMLRGSIYHYMDSKEGLLERIIEKATGESLAALAALDREGVCERESLRNFTYTLSLWCMENPEMVSIYVTEWKYLRGDGHEKARRRRDAVYAELLGHVTAAAPAELGDAAEPAFDPRYATLLILSAINGLPDWYRRSGADSAENIASIYADLVVGLMSGYDLDGGPD